MLSFSLLHEPLRPSVNSLPGLCADEEDFGKGISLVDTLYNRLIVEGEVVLGVDLIDNDCLADLKHQGILEGLVVAFRNRQDTDIPVGAGVVLGRAHQVSDVLEKDEVQALRIKGCEGIARHLRIHGTAAGRMDLNCRNPGLFHGLGINFGLNIGLHDPDFYIILLQCFYRFRHQIHHECALIFEFPPGIFGNAVVYGADRFMYFDCTKCSHISPSFHADHSGLP